MDANDIIKQYLSGKGGTALAKEAGCHKRVIYRTLRKAGITISRKRQVLNNTDIKDYIAGTSINALAAQHNRPRSVIMRNLQEAGVTLRSASEQEKIKWDAMRETPDVVARQMAGAHSALRGKGENLFIALLTKRGLACGGQTAFGAYHVDIALTSQPIAVEVQRRYISQTQLTPFAERLEYLLSVPLHVIYVMLPRDIPFTSSDLRRAADEVVTIAKSSRRTKACIGKYRVLRCTAKPVPFPCLDGYHVSDVGST